MVLRVTGPVFPTAWDSTMLGTFKECAKKHWYMHVLGYAPRGLSIHLYFGQKYHSALERYDHARASGQDHDAAVLAMVRWTLENTGERTCTSQCTSCDGSGWHKVPGVFDDTVPHQTFKAEPCENSTWTPWESGDPIKNRYTLIRSVVWQAEEERNSPLQTYILANGKPAVELSFAFDAFEVDGLTITLCGHMDKLATQAGLDSLWVVDRKTSKSALSNHFFQQFSPHNQFSLYTIAGKVVTDRKCEGVMVSAAQIQVGFTRFAQRPIARPQGVLDEWLSEAQWWIGQAKAMYDTGHFPGNDRSCGNYGGCPFAKICQVSPSHRLAHLKADFVKWEWNPLDARGDI